MNEPIYFNWEFWTAIVAALALVLSQMPPVYQLLRKAVLTMEVHPKALIGHKIGYPNIQLGIVLSNSGGRQAKIRDIKITVSREEKDVILPIQMYSPESEPTKQLLFAGFNIKPDEERNHNFWFYLDLPRNQERELKENTLKLRNDISAKKSLPENKDNLVEADPANVCPFHEILNRNFFWNEGEYRIKVRVETSDREIVEKDYRFTLYESDSTELRNYEQGYKYGEGILYGSENQWLWIRISEA